MGGSWLASIQRMSLLHVLCDVTVAMLSRCQMEATTGHAQIGSTGVTTDLQCMRPQRYLTATGAAAGPPGSQGQMGNTGKGTPQFDKLLYSVCAWTHIQACCCLPCGTGALAPSATLLGCMRRPRGNRTDGSYWQHRSRVNRCGASSKLIAHARLRYAGRAADGSD